MQNTVVSRAKFRPAANALLLLALGCGGSSEKTPLPLPAAMRPTMNAPDASPTAAALAPDAGIAIDSAPAQNAPDAAPVPPDSGPSMQPDASVADTLNSSDGPPSMWFTPMDFEFSPVGCPVGQQGITNVKATVRLESLRPLGVIHTNASQNFGFPDGVKGAGPVNIWFYPKSPGPEKYTGRLLVESVVNGQSTITTMNVSGTCL